MPADPLSSQRGLERQEKQGINTETDFIVLCLPLCRESANLFSYFPESHDKSSCALSVQVIIAGQLLGAAHTQKKNVQSLSRLKGLDTCYQGMCTSPPAVRQVYVSLGARKQAALGIRLQEPTAAPHQQKQSVRVGYSPVKGQAEQRCAGLLM